MFSLASAQDRHLIVFDLEWNQSSYAPNHRMPHEIIEIGACRVDRDYRVVDTFSAVIRPRLYKKLDKHIKSVTGITEAELEQGRPFSDVFGEFIAWCGEDVRLCTWGRDDFPVLKRNAAFFMTPMPFEPPVDAQLVFAHACLHSAHQQMNLHNALDAMEIVVDVPAHRAVYDAQCTAALLARIDEAVHCASYTRLIRRGLTAGASGTWRWRTARSTAWPIARCTSSACPRARWSCISARTPPTRSRLKRCARSTGFTSSPRRKSAITA